MRLINEPQHLARWVGPLYYGGTKGRSDELETAPKEKVMRFRTVHLVLTITPVVASVLGTFVIVSSAVAGPLEDGQAAADRGDYTTAMTVWKPIADKGDPHAQFDIGLLYETGHGVPLDYAEAAKWYRLSADQGLANAQDKLGFMYTAAKGVSQDYVQAAKWYRLSADQGLASAQHGLGILYSNGTGVPQDDISAYVWFKLAAAQGDKGASVNLNMLAKLMPPDKVTEAERQAREWKPKTQP